MLYRKYNFIIITCLLLGSCVSQQKYNSLIQARDNLELKTTEYSINLAQERTKALNLEAQNETLNRQLTQNSVDKQRISRELDQLRKSETELSNIHLELNSKYEDMKDYFEIVLRECDKDKIDAARKQRRLQQKEDSLQKALVELLILKEDLMERESNAKAKEVIAHSESTRIDAIFESLNRDLAGLVSSQFSISKFNEGVLISIDESALLEPGSLDITNGGEETIRELAIALNALEHIQITILGHTDRTKISRKARYLTDNWDWSVLKAATITRALTDAKLDPRVVTAAGRAEYDPMVSNQTEEGREKNKRTEIRVYPAVPDQANANTSQKAN